MFFRFVIITLAFLLANILNAKATLTSNTTNLIDERIVGGELQNIQYCKHQVAVIPAGYICGGTLVRLNWVVTAAHCTQGVSISNIKVRAGSNYWYKGGVLKSVIKNIVHRNFNANTLNNDIALLKVQSKFIKSPRIQAIQIADSLPGGGKLVRVSGYGTVASGGNLSKYLKSAYLKYVPFATCNNAYGNSLTDKMICAGVPTGSKDSCQGDSGGPLTYQGRLIGVVSWGDGCGTPGYPGVYTRAPKFKAWVNNKITKYS